MKLFARIDRCRAGRSPRLRIVGLDQPTAYADRRLHIGLHGRWGRMRLRIYLLGRGRQVFRADLLSG